MSLAPHSEAAIGLRRADLAESPIKQFERWFTYAVQMKLPEPNAMTLATASREGIPSARIVLLKGFDERGFAFFTNYESQKGRELDENPRAALVFHWVTLERQVRVVGDVSRVSREESEHYFGTRPPGSRLGAWASRQSSAIGSREELENRLAQVMETYKGIEQIPLPPYWGGYRVAPMKIEFWQGRPNRLHDRFRYTRLPSGEWNIERLSP